MAAPPNFCRYGRAKLLQPWPRRQTFAAMAAAPRGDAAALKKTCCISKTILIQLRSEVMLLYQKPCYFDSVTQ
jgi:hypothetical protein